MGHSCEYLRELKLRPGFTKFSECKFLCSIQDIFNIFVKCAKQKKQVTFLAPGLVLGKLGIFCDEGWEWEECWRGISVPVLSLSLLSVCCHVAQLRSGPLLWSPVSLWLHSEYVAGWSPLSARACTATIKKVYASMMKSSASKNTLMGV